MSKNDWDKWKKKDDLKQLKRQNIGRAVTDKDNLASYKQKRTRKGFVGRDVFKLQKGRGFIGGNKPFEVNWTRKKLLLVSFLVGISYCGLISLLYYIGVKIVAGILAAVGILVVSVCLLVRWLDKNT